MTMMRTRNQPSRLVGPPGRLPGAVRPGAGGLGITPRELLQIVRRRKLLILFTWLIIFGATFAVTFVWLQFWPWYTAEALLFVQPPEKELLAGRAPLYTRDAIERAKRTQATLAKSQFVLEEAAKDPQMTATGWWQEHRTEIVQELLDEITVSSIPQSSLLKLSMTGTRRRELPDIVNAVANAFVLHATKGTQKEVREEVNKLTAVRTDLKRELTKVRNDVAAAVAGSEAAGTEQWQNRVIIMLRMLLPQMAEAEIMQAQADGALSAFQDDINSGAAVRGPEVLRALELDPEVRSLKLQATELRTRLSNAVNRPVNPLGGQHRAVVGLKSMIEAVEDQVQERTNVVVNNTIESLRQIRQLELAAATRQLEELGTRLDKVKAQASDLEHELARVEALKKDAQDKEDNIRRIDTRILELQAALRGEPGKAAKELGPVSMYAQARVPLEPSKPRLGVWLPVGGVLGLVFGFGLAFLLELADTSIKNPGDIVRKVDLPLLGMVPHSDDLDEEIDDFRRVAILAPHSPAAEAFRQVRANLLFSGPAERRRSLLVTSPAPEDGRTTVVLNLAASMAQAGRRVLIVDANFRQPAIAALYPSAAAAGLSSALVGQTSWRDAVSATDVPNCDVVTSGPLPPNPAELLGSEAMRKIISEMTAEYDQVIFDGSPIMIVSDARVLATQVDGVVLVVRAGGNTVGVVQRAAEQLTRVGAHMLGVVLQGVRTTAGGYLRKNYETFYEYHQRSLP